MPGSRVSDHGMNTSLPEHAREEASEQDGRRAPVMQNPVQHTMSSNTSLRRHQVPAEDEWWNDEAIQAPGWEQPGLKILSDPPMLSEHLRRPTNAVEIKAGQWKLLQDVPSLNVSFGGLQLQQWISEFTTVASCESCDRPKRLKAGMMPDKYS